MELPKSPRRWTRRAFIASLATAGAGASALGYMRGVEPDWFEVNEVFVPRGIFPGPEGLRILHLTDLHLSSVVPLGMIAEAIRLGLAMRPDIICLTGDYVTGRIVRDKAAYAEVLRPLASAAPTFACAGNHDGMPGANPRVHETDPFVMGGVLESAGIRFLHNQSVVTRVRGEAVRVVGVGDLWAGHLRPDLCLAPREAGCSEPTLLLCHNPDGWSRWNRLPGT